MEAAKKPTPIDEGIALELKYAQWGDEQELGNLVALSFTDNSAYRYIFQEFPDDAERQTPLRWLLMRRISCFLFTGAPVIKATTEVNGEQVIVATASLVTKKNKPGYYAMFRNGILKWPFIWGMASLKRALSLNKSQVNRGGGAELALVVVHPDFQGKGVGTRLLRRLLDDHGKDMDLTLNTQRAINVTFYQRFGFQETSKDTVSGAYTNWYMVRPKG